MDDHPLWYLALAGLLAMSAFFSGSETALIGSQRLQLETMAANGDRAARRTLRLLERPGSLLATLLVGNNLVNVAAASLGAMLWGPLVSTVVMTLMLLMIGEIPPKTLAAHWPTPIARAVSLPVMGMRHLFSPVVWLASGLTDLLLFPFTRTLRPARRFYSRDELSNALSESLDAGELEPGEAVMAQEVLDLPRVSLDEIMIPCDEAARLSLDWSRERVLEEIRLRRFSRYPVFETGSGRPTGMLHIKDLLLARPTDRWQSLLRWLPLRPREMSADDLLREMQIRRFHMAGVTDEAGTMVGFVTMEGILEQIVGEIADEHDLESDPVRMIEPKVFQVRSGLEVADVARILNVDLPGEGEQTIDEVYRAHAGPSRVSGVRLGDALFRPCPQGYMVDLLDSPVELTENGEAEADR